MWYYGEKKRGGKSVSRGQTMQTLLDDGKEFEFILEITGKSLKGFKRAIRTKCVPPENGVLAIWRMGMVSVWQTKKQKQKTRNWGYWGDLVLYNGSLDLVTETGEVKDLKMSFGDVIDRIFFS